MHCRLFLACTSNLLSIYQVASSKSPSTFYIFVIAASPLLSANFCLSQFGLLKQSIIDQVVYKQQKLISHTCEGWKSELRVPAQSQPWGADFSSYPHRTGQQAFTYC